MTGGGSSSPSSSSSPPTNPRHHLPPPLDTSAAHNGTATSKPPPPLPPPPPPQQQQQQREQQQHTPPLLLTVRFSTSIPDLLLDIPHPRRTTVAALKHLIRSRLEQPNSQRRLRFIHGGKILPDNAVLAAVLKALPPPPPPSSTSSTARDDPHQDPTSQVRGQANGKGKGKGKGKAVEGQQAQRVYVNCSIGDQLTDAELDEERRKAEEPVPEAPPADSTAAGEGALSSPFQFRPGGSRHSPAAGERAPRGFDRLLSAGFTAAEVNQLRLQFRSIQAARHTADTMPSPDALRGLEDAWIDNNNDAGTGIGGAGAAAAAAAAGDGEEAGGAGGEEFGIAGVLDLLLRGMFIGFVWPLGAVGWLVRDEEKIPKRMRVFVYFGFVLSLLVGTMRAIG